MDNIQKNNADIKLNILKGFKEFDDILEKAHKIKLESACGIVIHDNKVLLGLSNASDDRSGKWCFPGGGIDKNEDCISASIRETYEEMGIQSKSTMPTIIFHVTKPMVGFCLLNTENPDTLLKNEEFEEIGWFDIDNLPEETMLINKDILNLVNCKTL